MAEAFEFIVSGGEVFSGLTAGDGQPNATSIKIVSSGGTAIGDDIGSGGSELVQSRGLATDTDLYGGTPEAASGRPDRRSGDQSKQFHRKSL